MKRYHYDSIAGPSLRREDPNGEWVRYEDAQVLEGVITLCHSNHQQLMDQYMALRAEHEKLRERMQRIADLSPEWHTLEEANELAAEALEKP